MVPVQYGTVPIGKEGFHLKFMKNFIFLALDLGLESVPRTNFRTKLIGVAAKNEPHSFYHDECERFLHS